MDLPVSKIDFTLCNIVSRGKIPFEISMKKAATALRKFSDRFEIIENYLEAETTNSELKILVGLASHCLIK